MLRRLRPERGGAGCRVLAPPPSCESCDHPLSVKGGGRRGFSTDLVAQMLLGV